MLQSPAVKRALGFGLKAALVLSAIAPLVTRVIVGYAFYESGMGKLARPEVVTTFFADLGIPFPALNAAFVSRLEYWGGLALLVGLGTRLFAFLLSSTMVVALLTADKEAFLENWAGGLSGLTTAAGLGDAPATAPFLLLALMSWLIFHGPGWASVDAVVAWAARKRGLLPAAETSPLAEIQPAA
jgi:putative oxidoreductase